MTGRVAIRLFAGAGFARGLRLRQRRRGLPYPQMHDARMFRSLSVTPAAFGDAAPVAATSENVEWSPSTGVVAAKRSGGRTNYQPGVE